MEIVENSYANLPNGTEVIVKGKELAKIRFIRERKSEKDRRDKEEPRTYYHFSIGGRGFTIDETDMDSVELLRDKAKRKTVACVYLEATTHQVPKLDDDLQPIDGEYEERKSFRFVAVVTTEDAKAYAKNEGEVAQEEAKWQPKTNVVTDDKLSAMVHTSIANILPSAIANALKVTAGEQ